MTKKDARTRMKILRREMPLQERSRQDQWICDYILHSDILQQVDWIFPYVSYGTEVDTHTFIASVLKTGQKEHNVRVAVPRVDGDHMDFYEIASMNQLQPGYGGILEPIASCSKVEAVSGLMIMPGLAYDTQYNRVGYGGGFYDRYLKKYGNSQLITWAVAYDCQMLNEPLEAEPQDIRPDRVVFCSQY